MDNQDQHPANGAPTPAPPTEAAAPVNQARRRFARAGLGASGMILTLASQPGMAATRVCKSASGSLSGGLQSRPTDQPLACGGLSPGYWMNHEQQWPSGTYAADKLANNSKSAGAIKLATLFVSIFPGGSGIYGTHTLMQMLQDNKGADPFNLGMHLTACYLNIKSEKISYMTVESLQLMWHDVLVYGYYEPRAGVKWGAEQVKIFLESTEGDAP